MSNHYKWQGTMNLNDIKRRRTVIDNNHESLYKSYHILRYVLEMVERGDSKETIFDVVEMLQDDELTEAD